MHQFYLVIFGHRAVGVHVHSGKRDQVVQQDIVGIIDLAVGVKIDIQQLPLIRIFHVRDGIYRDITETRHTVIRVQINIPGGEPVFQVSDHHFQATVKEYLKLISFVLDAQCIPGIPLDLLSDLHEILADSYPVHDNREFDRIVVEFYHISVREILSPQDHTGVLVKAVILDLRGEVHVFPRLEMSRFRVSIYTRVILQVGFLSSGPRAVYDVPYGCIAR